MLSTKFCRSLLVSLDCFLNQRIRASRTSSRSVMFFEKKCKFRIHGTGSLPGFQHEKEFLSEVIQKYLISTTGLWEEVASHPQELQSRRVGSKRHGPTVYNARDFQGNYIISNSSGGETQEPHFRRLSGKLPSIFTTIRHTRRK